MRFAVLLSTGISQAGDDSVEVQMTKTVSVTKILSYGVFQKFFFGVMHTYLTGFKEQRNEEEYAAVVGWIGDQECSENRHYFSRFPSLFDLATCRSSLPPFLGEQSPNHLQICIRQH